MPDDHSKLVPLLPIPNRTVKRLCADDSADSRVKVGHRQAVIDVKTPSCRTHLGVLLFFADRIRVGLGVVLQLSTVDDHLLVKIQGTAFHQFIQQTVEPPGALRRILWHMTT